MARTETQTLSQDTYAYRNRKAEVVGFDADMAHDLARTLGVKLEFVRLKRETYLDQVQQGYCDILMSGIVETPRATEKVSFSTPYLDETLAFIVKDHLRDQFASWDSVREMEGLKVGIVAEPFYDLKYYQKEVDQYLSHASVQLLDSPRAFFKQRPATLDALIYTAEAGSAWTVLYPDYTVVIPKPSLLSVPLAYAVAKQDTDLLEFANAWIALKKGDQMIKRFFDHWILGKGAENPQPRWSVIRNVLGWVD